jgi:bifunctional DNA-binding transcriptional regulator/antitoxin component of YhaV-PrlF toxin-antitoxin module
MFKKRQVCNGKSVVPIYPSFKFSSMLTIPTRIAHKYNLKQSHVIIEERGDGGFFIKKADTETRTKTFLTGTTGKHSSCGLTIPSYLARKYGYAGDGCYVVLTEEDDGIFMKKLLI